MTKMAHGSRLTTITLFFLSFLTLLLLLVVVVAQYDGTVSNAETTMQFQTYPMKYCRTFPPQNSIPTAFVDSIGACSDVCFEHYNRSKTFGLSGRACHCFPNGSPTNAGQVVAKSFCEETVAFQSTRGSTDTLKELRGVDHQYMIYFEHLPPLAQQGSTAAPSRLGTNNTLNMGMPSIINATQTQISSSTSSMSSPASFTTGMIPVSNSSTPVDLGPVAPGIVTVKCVVLGQWCFY